MTLSGKENVTMKSNLMILGKLVVLIILATIPAFYLQAQTKVDEGKSVNISMAPFGDSMRHWYGIRDNGNIIQPKVNQPRYKETEVTNIADNILLYQRNNGGWPKNYDMQAILLPEQVDSLLKTKDQHHTTFDNSTTYPHIEYLAKVYSLTNIEKLGTHKPLFCDRNSKFLYSMAEVSRERRVGYAWYTYAPQKVLDNYPEWQQKWSPENTIPRDTSFTPYMAWIKIRKEFPQAQIVRPILPEGVLAKEDIVYASLPETPYGKRELHLDLFRPDKSGKYPALIHVFGGGWRSGNKSMQVPMAQQIAAKGYVTASVEYRLSPEALYPAAVYDIKAAIRFLRANAAKYNIDPDKIAITGSSAGGQLAALIGATSSVEKFEGNEGNRGVSSAVQAIIDMDGVLDFDTPDEKGKDEETAKRSAGALWFGATFREAPEKWKEASAIHYVGKNTPPMLFINSALPRFHYGRDSVIAILDKHGIYTEVHAIENTPHPFWLFHPWFEPTVKYMVDFLDKVLK